MTYRTALIVDDDPVFGALAEDLLLDAGIETIETAADGGEALARIDAGGPVADIMMCDLNMPTHDGVTVMRGLAERRYPGRIIIVSGEADAVRDTVVKLARLQGLNILGSTRKPLTPASLAELLARAPSSAPKSVEQAPATSSLLDAAIERGGLHPFFQAKISMATGRISGSEALARIATPISPHANPVPYVELAERNHRIDALTFAMTRAVARCVLAFNSTGVKMPCSINISPASLNRLDFPDQMAGLITDAGLSCEQFTLEVTETRLVEYGPRVLDVMTRLRIKGFGLSVDDFGTGYSNIDRLQMYPFTELKIDQSFTKKALEESFARACVETSVRLAKELGLKIVAEGVETREMWDFLKLLEVDEAQGYLMSKPLPPADYRAMLVEGRTFEV
ncbi:MAG: EAL domain-containing response regulator [Alphaproteobacteria bacterium]|nr:EAL domain-containing response regulator [Alphaproteobacteria bacterium]